MESLMQHISLRWTCTESLRLYCCQLLSQSHEERKTSLISIPWLDLQGLHCSTVALLVYAVHTLLSCMYRSTARCSKVSRLPLVEHMCLILRLSLCLSLPSPHSLSACFSGCHIMSLSLTGHVDTCRLGSGPSVCRGEGDIWWAKWTEASGNWFHLSFSKQDTQRESYLLWDVSMCDTAVTQNEWWGRRFQLSSVKARVWICIITWNSIHWIWFKGVKLFVVEFLILEGNKGFKRESFFLILADRKKYHNLESLD